jgi:molybdopterin synthase sulfur carrier subunit
MVVRIKLLSRTAGEGGPSPQGLVGEGSGMAARVQFTSGFSRRYTGGVREFTVEAKNLRGVIKEMDRLYPGLGEHLEEETTVAIDGAIHETAYFQPIREGCEIFFIPKLEGG